MDMNLFWNVAQQQQLRDTHRAVDAATDTAHRATQEAVELRASIERLALASRAMWELLAQQTALGEEDLLAKVRELDLRDGSPDGKLRPEPKRCAKCTRTNNARHVNCLYCGNPLPSGSPFNSI